MSIDLLNMDCMDYMRELPANAFELAIVDPPYGIGNWICQGGSSDKSIRIDAKDALVTWNDDIPDMIYFNELLRVSKNQIIWGANYYNIFPLSGGAIVWYKSVVHPNFSKCEIASCSFHKKVEYVSIPWRNIARDEDATIHPCQKPIKLYEWIMTKYAKEGDRILDTHLGSGSSAIAEHNLGFDLVGIELDADYFAAAKQRLDNHMKQPALFPTPLKNIEKVAQSGELF